MNEHSPITPSELIYLFIDGEADHVEQTLLFKALADDSDLQAEFQRVMHIRSAVEYDKEITHPSAEVTNALFAKAGFASSAAAAAGSAAQVITSSASTATTSATTSAAIGMSLKTIAGYLSSQGSAYLLAGILGAALMAGILVPFYESQNDDQLPLGNTAAPQEQIALVEKRSNGGIFPGSVQARPCRPSSRVLATKSLF